MFKHLRTSGFTMLEVLIGAAILTVVGLAMMTLITTMTNSQRMSSDLSNAQIMTDDVAKISNDRGMCTCNLKGYSFSVPAYPSTIPDDLVVDIDHGIANYVDVSACTKGKILYAPGHSNENGIEVQRVSLKDIQWAGVNNRFRANLTMEFVREHKAGGPAQLDERKRKVPVYFTGSMGAGGPGTVEITRCLNNVDSCQRFGPQDWMLTTINCSNGAGEIRSFGMAYYNATGIYYKDAQDSDGCNIGFDRITGAFKPTAASGNCGSGAAPFYKSCMDGLPAIVDDAFNPCH